MELPDLFDLLAYWRTAPPVHLLVRDAVHYRPPSERAAAPAFRESTEEEIRAFVSSFGAGN
jgi:hypothetical protein